MRAGLLCLLAACGDNLARPAYDSPFDGTDELLVFGDLGQFPGLTRPDPLPGIEVCVEDACDTTADDGSFVVRAPGALHETIVELRTAVPTIVPVVPGTLHERNLGGTVTLSPETFSTSAAGFGEQLAFDRAGMILLVAEHNSTDPISFAIDGATTRYFDASAKPDPTRTELSSRGSAAWFGVPPGEVTIRTTAGSCSLHEDGWPGTAPGELRVPVVLGSMTIVRPICH